MSGKNHPTVKHTSKTTTVTYKTNSNNQGTVSRPSVVTKTPHETKVVYRKK